MNDDELAHEIGADEHDERHEARIEQIIYGLLNHPADHAAALALIAEAIDDAGWPASEQYLRLHPDQIEAATARRMWVNVLLHAIATGDEQSAGRMLCRAVERYARKIAEQRIAGEI